jgi:serine/threonine-protein kinase
MMGRYELVHLLGQGGMGEVWLAKLSGTAGFEKPCIVKTVLPALLKDRQFLDRFHHEAKVLVHLVHSSIAQVYDMGEAEGTCYIALEYVAGVDLAYLEEQARARGQGLPVPVALYLGQRMAEGLGYAHRKTGPDGTPLGIVHRDVSPHNVMVSYDGEVKVIDFGLAKSAARSKYTLPSTVMGKLGYMSPEQARAEPVDARGDIYSCGVVVWELLAGRPLVAHGTVGEMMAAMAHPSVPALHELRPDVSPELDAVVRRALAPRPEERYARADDFARALAEQFHRLGATLGGEEVGAWVREVCPEAFAAQRRLISKISSPGLRRPPATPLPGSLSPEPAALGAALGPTGTARFSPVPAAPVSGYEATALRPVSEPPAPAAAPPASTPAPVAVGPAVQGLGAGSAPPAAPVPAPARASRGRPLVLAVAALGLVGATAGVTAFLVKGSAVGPSPVGVSAAGAPPHGPPFPPRGGPPSGPPPGPPPETVAEARPAPPPEGPPPREAPPAPKGDVPATPVQPKVEFASKKASSAVLISAKSVVGMFQDGQEHFVRVGSKQGLEMGSVLTVVGPPVKGGKRRKLGEATVVEVWPVLARVSLDAGARSESGKHFAVLPEAPVKPEAPVEPVVAEAVPAEAPAPAASEVKKGLVGRASFTGVGPFRKIVLFNTDTRTWNGCKVALRGRRSYDFGALAPGGKRGALVREFRIDAQVPFLPAGRVHLRCDEGEGEFYVRE